MKKFWLDWIALSVAALGIVLMVFTIAWRINPVEGSVVPQFLKDNPFGMAVLWILLVTCMPVWILANLVLFGGRLPAWLPSWMPADLTLWAITLILQAMVYFLIGKGISSFVRRQVGRNAR